MEFETIIGLEIHAQISTKTKMFCRCDNDSFNKEANINTCEVCMGFPGQLPVINQEAVQKGLKSALALNCEIPEICKFDRKNYFYPDSPKGFQISQYDEPISQNGFIEIDVEKDNQKYSKKIRITRLHLEDDAGKLTHTKDGSLIDFNRSGTPLMEIVSEPDMRNAEEAVEYAKEIQKILRYVDGSEADMEKGMMRFDASVSIRPKGDNKLYPRSEIKNLNSFKALESAIKYEEKKQKKDWENGIKKECASTVGWNTEKNETYFMREKEESNDYRYFPEPDLPPLKFTKKEVETIKNNLPELPRTRKQRYINELQLQEDDARILSEDKKLGEYFEKTIKVCKDTKKAVSFINTILMKHLKEEYIEIDQQNISPEMMGELINEINEGTISNNTAKTTVFDEMYTKGKTAKQVIEEKGLKQVSDTSAIENSCKKILSENPNIVEEIKNGKDKAIGFLVGQVMKEMKGQANPAMINETIKNLIQ